MILKIYMFKKEKRKNIKILTIFYYHTHNISSYINTNKILQHYSGGKIPHDTIILLNDAQQFSNKLQNSPL